MRGWAHILTPPDSVGSTGDDRWTAAAGTANGIDLAAQAWRTGSAVGEAAGVPSASVAADRVISGSYSSVVLLHSGDNPVYVTGTIAVAGGSALIGPGDPTGTNSWTIDNSGLISAAGTKAVGIELGRFGTHQYVFDAVVTNEAGATIYGRDDAIYVNQGVYAYPNISATVANSGTIASLHFEAIGFTVNGVVENAAGGLIVGGEGVAMNGTVTNAGTIEGTGSTGVSLHGVIDNGRGGLIVGGENGVALFGLGTSLNAGDIVGVRGDGVVAGSSDSTLARSQVIVNSGRISGAVFGVHVLPDYLPGDTVINSGTISGASGTAVYFGSGFGFGNNLLVLQPGYALGGVVVGGASVTNAVELEGSAGAPLTVNYNGLGLVNFQDLLFGSAGYDTLLVANTAGTLAPTISGFAQPSDVIDLTAIGTDGTIGSFDTAGHLLTVEGSGGSLTLSLDASDAAGFMTMPDGAGGTDLVAGNPCFCRGTLILTARGEVAVEALAIGERVVTVSGELRPIKWIGRRSYAGRFALGQRHILPICVRAGALADGMPQRDLWLSPNHALFLEGLLVEARHLVNGTSIVQPPAAAGPIEYFHIELDGHDVIVADGAFAESYVDDNNRLLFHNAGDYRGCCWAADAGPARYCAPRRDSGWAVEHVRASIAARAGLALAVETAACGPLRGHVDQVGRRHIAGWALDERRPDVPVCLDILAGGRLIAQVVANRYRPDLAAAGRGSGWHGFALTPPIGIEVAPRSVAVRRSCDGASLARAARPRRSLDGFGPRRARR